VLKVCPSSSKAGAAWAAEPLSPALSGGLLGYSVVLWGSRAFVFGGMQESNNSDPTDGKSVQKHPSTPMHGPVLLM